MGNKTFLRGFFTTFIAIILFCVGIWFITENADYVSTSIGSLDFETGTVEVQATIYIDDDRVMGYVKTVDYCDRKETKKELKQKGRATIKEINNKCK